MMPHAAQHQTLELFAGIGLVLAVASVAASGVGTDSYSKRKLNPAFSSQRCTRAPW